MSGYGRLVADDKGLNINVCDENSSEEGGDSILQHLHAKHVSDDFSHCDNLCGVLTVVGGSSDWNERALVLATASKNGPMRSIG